MCTSGDKTETWLQNILLKELAKFSCCKTNEFPRYLATHSELSYHGGPTAIPRLSHHLWQIYSDIPPLQLVHSTLEPPAVDHFSYFSPSTQIPSEIARLHSDITPQSPSGIYSAEPWKSLENSLVHPDVAWDGPSYDGFQNDEFLKPASLLRQGYKNNL